MFLGQNLQEVASFLNVLNRENLTLHKNEGVQLPKIHEVDDNVNVQIYSVEKCKVLVSTLEQYVTLLHDMAMICDTPLLYIVFKFHLFH